MSDRDLDALAAEALTIARRLHADWDRLGEIIAVECQDLLGHQGNEKLVAEWTRFVDRYFGFDGDTPAELRFEKDSDLSEWAVTWENIPPSDYLPPLPIADELDRDLAEELR